MTAVDTTTFDLVEQPWLPVRMVKKDGADGALAELSLVDVFARAHEVATVFGDLPTQDFALLRLLLAILHRALNGPRTVDDWERLWESERLPADEIARYLDQHRSRFDLLHPETPFFQVAGLCTTKGETSELNKLIADVPNGRPFFTTRLGPIHSVSLAEAARWLVHCQAFDPSGIKSGADGDDRVKNGKGYPIGVGWSGRLGGVVPQAVTLRETLLLNLIPVEVFPRPFDADLPPWERKPLGPTVREEAAPTGPVDLYTWQSRRIRLVAEGDRVTRVLICNGDSCDPPNRHRVEPHTRWRRSQAQQKRLGEAVVYMPLEHNPERAVWRGLQSLLPGAFTPQSREAASGLPAGVLEWLATLTDEEILDRNFQVRIRVIGMVYGSQSSVTDEVIDDVLPLHAELLRHGAPHLVGVALSCVDAADQAARALGQLALNLARAAGKVPPNSPGLPDPADVAERTRAVELAYAELDRPFREWLTGLGPDIDPVAAQVAWHRRAERIIRQLADDLRRRAPEAAWVGRWVNNRPLTATHAVEWFRRALREALPYAHEDARTSA
ncbi:CRISPR system Cascade subunit CasA [Amycolatopsis arida]|uniref:CRISPR system Cascade subunit CasA n=1 Tax=Amycolatopsis arida TaxID=587909 RepID=A0A1I5R1L7_9PSEU|nr:type I-E CRISPR-associated protein Cse1/CasA [Amycolatopsis arida]TDX99042.1 CRISPR system Cascade subunit CasA [Amycolatopsis arida]SFP52402.1 CRISPR system Cascade subunit CasA [Amycolatopsis arida]